MKKILLGIFTLISTMSLAQNDIIKGSEKYSEVVSNFGSKLGQLDFALSQIREGLSLHITIVPFTKDEDGKVPGMVVFVSDNKDCLMAMVYDYTDLVLEDNKFTGGNYSMHFSDGSEFALISSNNGQISFEEKFKTEGAGVSRERVSLPKFMGLCVSQCYTNWKKNCERDPICDTFCDFAPCGTFELYECAKTCIKAWI